MGRGPEARDERGGIRKMGWTINEGIETESQERAKGKTSETYFLLYASSFQSFLLFIKIPNKAMNHQHEKKSYHLSPGFALPIPNP